MQLKFGKQAPQAAPRIPDKPQFQASLRTDGALELMIYGEIVDAAYISMLEYYGVSTDGFISAMNIKKALEESAAATKIAVRINSPGGDAFEGVAIHALLSSQPRPVEVMIDGIAASAASIIAMAGSVRLMGRSAMMMIHNAWGGCIGNASDMQKMADTLGKIDESLAQAYIARTGQQPADVLALMDAETWMSAADCVELGFATGLAEQSEAESAQALNLARGFQALNRLKQVPSALRPGAKAAPLKKAKPKAAADPDPECACDCESCMNGLCADCINADCNDAICQAAGCPMQSTEASNLSLYEARATMLLRH